MTRILGGISMKKGFSNTATCAETGRYRVASVGKAAALALALVLMLAMVACGKEQPGDGGSNAGNDGEVDISRAAENLMDEAVENNAFSEAAANAWLKKNAGVDKSTIEPDFPYRIDESLMSTYGDSPDSPYGHGSIMFIDEDGDLTEDEWHAWMRKVFDATARVSDDGHNIFGFEGNEDNPNGEISFEDAMGIGSDAWIVMQGWSYRVNGMYLHAYVEQVEDPQRESEVETVDGQMTLKYFYYAGKVDITIGLQKSFGDTMSDLEDAFEEHEDEIKEALEDYAR
jgi:hypothetical protein